MNTTFTNWVLQFYWTWIEFLSLNWIFESEFELNFIEKFSMILSQFINTSFFNWVLQIPNLFWRLVWWKQKPQNYPRLLAADFGGILGIFDASERRHFKCATETTDNGGFVDVVKLKLGNELFTPIKCRPDSAVTLPLITVAYSWTNFVTSAEKHFNNEL